MSEGAEALVRVYGAASVSRFTGIEGDAVAIEAVLAERFRDKAARKKVLAALPEESVEFLAFMDQVGRRLRAERLKKRWFLHGYDDFEARVEPLIYAGIVIVGNLQAREPVSLETALEQGLLLQWIQVTPGFESMGGTPPPAREVVQQVEDETSVELARRTLVVEFDILNCLRYIESEGIRLNRDGSPHRSDLKGLAPLIIDRPGASGRGDAAPDPLTVDGWDVLSFLLSIAEALGLIERSGDTLRATGRAVDYFIKPLEERVPLLFRALEHQRAWSELDASQWFQAGEPPTTGEGDGGFDEDASTGSPLAGPRASVSAALRRLNPVDWFDVEETARTITNLELVYLKAALPIPTGDEQSPGAFVRTFITRALAHVGAIELGRGGSGGARARLTPIGKAMLGMGDCPEEASGRGSILVEPNFEITAFLDICSLRLLFDLSRFADLTRTSERVARYRLHGESAQRGYARGYTADGTSSLLAEYSAQPLPPSVTFALQDWERLHRRVSVFVNGDLVASSGRSDPEVIQSGVEFVISNADHVERIDAIHTYVAAGHIEALERALDAAKPRVIDYDGAVVPTLEWVDESSVRAPIGATDLRSLAGLLRVATAEGDDRYRIDPDLVRKSFGSEAAGFDAVVAILRDGLIGGLSPEREIALKGLLGRPADGRIGKMEVLLLGADDDGERVGRIDSVAPFIAERLGPRAFRVAPGKAKELAERLRALGIAVEI
ncbi:MAG: helicase-associated domain-containing protein [Myxococcales bacterium]|nr:helicase-associated domain-containing protein [Myxococcales bacterium]MCB9532335.1 helicase-associated domain-containing protein [Myxococcales bacterium]MCB9534591.1 helicase-associated domain-containing protein [Myxococcales bacterium]